MRNYRKNLVVDSDSLRAHAELLDAAIKSHLGESRDVDFLANLPTLNQALEEARKGTISCPRKLGLTRWIMESDIQEFPDIADGLAGFEWLLDGWELPREELEDKPSSP